MGGRVSRAAVLAAPVLAGGLAVLALAGMSGIEEGTSGAEAPRAAVAGTPRARADVCATFAALPLAFEEDRGQAPAEAAFVARAPGLELRVAPAGSVLRLRGPGGAAEVRMRLLGAREDARLEGIEELPGRTSYLVGRDPAGWRTGVRRYAKVASRGVYPGVDIVFYGSGGSLEYDLVVAPGADPRAIALRFEGADDLSVSASGDLVLRTPAGDLVQRAPRVYQRGADGREAAVPSRYVLRRAAGADVGVEVGFEVAAYDAARPLVIDPVLVYASFLGGDLNDLGTAIAVDASGNVYVTGRVHSVSLPVRPTNAFQPTHGADAGLGSENSKDAFVAKLNPGASGAASLVYLTYLGGSGADEGWGIAVGASGTAVVTGFTFSGDFPTLNAVQTTLQGTGDAFVTRLDATGTGIVSSTYLGGDGNDFGFGVAVDGSDNAYVQGRTESTSFPAIMTTIGSGGGADAFVAKLAPAGAPLAYAVRLGGSGPDEALMGIAVNASGEAFVTGATGSTDFPTTPANAFQSSDPGDGGGTDGFIARVDTAGTGLLYSTYLGGIGDDACRGIRLDGPTSAYVVGETRSTDFPTTVGAFQASDPDSGGEGDAFVAKVDTAASGGASLPASTYLGGNGFDRAFDVDLDATGVYVAGETSSTNFPITADALQAGPSGGFDIFVTKLDLDLDVSQFSTYLGGAAHDGGSETSTTDMGLAVDPGGGGAIYLLANTASTGITATADAFDGGANGAFDLYVAKICIGDILPPVFACPAGVTVTTGALGTAGTPTLTAGVAASDNCTRPGLVAVTQTPTAGTALGCGTFTVTVTATDDEMNPASCEVSVTVLDATAPAVTCPAPASAVADAVTGTAQVPDFTVSALALDNCTSSGSFIIGQTPPAGTLLTCGAHAVTVTVQDQALNTGSCTTTFTVIDATAPTISVCPPSATVTGDLAGNVAMPDLTTPALLVASDNCTPAASLVVTQSPPAGTVVGPGVLTVTVTVTDQAGNSVSCVTSVTVVAAPAALRGGGGCAAGAAAGDPWLLLALAPALAARALAALRRRRGARGA